MKSAKSIAIAGLAVCLLVHIVQASSKQPTRSGCKSGSTRCPVYAEQTSPAERDSATVSRTSLQPVSRLT